MDSCIERFRQRVDEVRMHHRGQSPRLYVGSYESEVNAGGVIELPDPFMLERSDELVVGLDITGEALLVYESFVWHLMEEVTVESLKASLEELMIRSEEPSPAFVYVEGGKGIRVPKSLLDAAGITGTVRIEGHGHGFRLVGSSA